MNIAVGVKFDPEWFAEFFVDESLGLREEEFCIVRDDRGNERVGYVSCREGRAPCQCERLPKIARRATTAEIARWHEQCRRTRQALALAREKVLEHELPMKINSVRFNDAENEIVFYFSADRRIDFRALVRDLAAQFKARIELWQIGSRQAAGEINGYGHCGRQLCCAAWIQNFQAVAIRHARTQDISQNPPKLSGFCGRLRCCLRYELEAYRDLSRTAPDRGETIRDDQGAEALIVDRNLLRQSACLQYPDGTTRWLPFSELTRTTESARPQTPLEPPEAEVEDEVVEADENGPDEPIF